MKHTLEQVTQHNQIAVGSAKGKITDYNQLIKTRLTALVVISAAITYLTAASNSTVNWFDFLISYAFVYTPMKRISPISVFVGAFPGALPVLIGYTAFSGTITDEALLLFGVQFFWQFPHFWSIAWILDDDYKRAGFKMLPTYGKDKRSALITLAFTLCLIPMGLMPTFEGYTGIVSGVIALSCALILTYFAFKLYRTCENKDAKRLMFASFLYLPIVQIAYWLDKL